MNTGGGFCTDCGATKVPEITGRFDGDTGEPIVRFVCSRSPCVHGSHLWRDQDRGNWFMNCFFPREVCVRCGRKRLVDAEGNW